MDIAASSADTTYQLPLKKKVCARPTTCQRLTRYTYQLLLKKVCTFQRLTRCTYQLLLKKVHQIVECPYLTSQLQPTEKVSLQTRSKLSKRFSILFFLFFFCCHISPLQAVLLTARVSVPPSFPHDAGCLTWTSADGQDVTRETLQTTMTPCWCLWDRFFGDRCRFHRPTN